MYNALLGHLVASRAFLDSAGEATIASTVRAYRVGWAIYVISTLLALVAPVASFAAYIAVAGYYLIPRGVDADM